MKVEPKDKKESWRMKKCKMNIKEKRKEGLEEDGKTEK